MSIETRLAPTPIPSLDLGQLRRTCAACALHDLCLPASISANEMHALDAIVRARRPLDRGQQFIATHLEHAQALSKKIDAAPKGEVGGSAAPR